MSTKLKISEIMKQHPERFNLNWIRLNLITSMINTKWLKLELQGLSADEISTILEPEIEAARTLLKILQSEKERET